MKSITWVSYQQALQLLDTQPDAHVISVGCKYGSDIEVIEKVRKKAKHVYPVNVTLDALAEHPFEGLGEFLLTIPEDGDLIIHCNEGRFRSRYIMEALQSAWGDVFDDYVSCGQVHGIASSVSRDDTWGIIRPLRIKFGNLLSQALKDAKDGKVESGEATGGDGA